MISYDYKIIFGYDHQILVFITYLKVDAIEQASLIHSLLPFILIFIASIPYLELPPISIEV